MTDVSARDLRNRTAEVLRRVEAGERIRINVNRRPVAELIPLGRPARPPARRSSGSSPRARRMRPYSTTLPRSAVRRSNRGVTPAPILDHVDLRRGRAGTPTRAAASRHGCRVGDHARGAQLGVLVARDADTRARRLGTLTRLREQTAGLPADDRVASPRTPGSPPASFRPAASRACTTHGSPRPRWFTAPRSGRRTTTSRRSMSWTSSASTATGLRRAPRPCVGCTGRTGVRGSRPCWRRPC